MKTEVKNYTLNCGASELVCIPTKEGESYINPKNVVHVRDIEDGCCVITNTGTHFACNGKASAIMAKLRD
jgi:hypothetical protein